MAESTEKGFYVSQLLKQIQSDDWSPFSSAESLKNIFVSFFFFHFPEELEEIEDTQWKYYWLEQIRIAIEVDYELIQQNNIALFKTHRKSSILIDLESSSIGTILFYCTPKEYQTLKKKMENLSCWQVIPFQQKSLYHLIQKAPKLDSFEIISYSIETKKNHALNMFKYLGRDAQKKALFLLEKTLRGFCIQKLKGQLLAESSVPIQLFSDGWISWKQHSDTMTPFFIHMKSLLETRFEAWKNQIQRWEWDEEYQSSIFEGEPILFHFSDEWKNGRDFIEIISSQARKMEIHIFVEKLTYGLQRLKLFSLTNSANLTMNISKDFASCYLEKPIDILLAWRLEAIISHYWGWDFSFEK